MIEPHTAETVVHEEMGGNDQAGPARPVRILAIVPAYNEERFIGSVVLRARKYVDAVVVVDDGSADATAEIAQAAGAIVVRHPTNSGKGAALNSGFRKARELGAEAVALLDGDGQHRPDDIPAMMRPVLEGQADMVIGSRYIGVKGHIPWYRRLGQTGVTLLTNAGSGVPSTDSWSGYRAFSAQALECIRFREGGWGVDPEFQFQCREHGLRVTEVPIRAIYEEKAKRNPIPHGLKTVNAILRLTGQHRPLLFFGVAGLLILVAAMVIGLRVVSGFDASGRLAVGMALLVALLVIIGVLVSTMASCCTPAFIEFLQPRRGHDA